MDKVNAAAQNGDYCKQSLNSWSKPECNHANCSQNGVCSFGAPTAPTDKGDLSQIPAAAQNTTPPKSSGTAVADPKTVGGDTSGGAGNTGSSDTSQAQTPKSNNPSSDNSNPSPSTSPSSTPTSSGDQAACNSAHTAADAACGGSPPSSYMSSATGINTSSAEYANAMQSSANANYNWMTNCTAAFNNCRNSCQTVDPSAASACANYASKVQQVAQQTQQNINDYQAASAAQQASVDAPPTSPQINPTAPGCANDPAGALCQTCSANPSNAACQPQPQGTSGFASDSASTSPTGTAGFNVPDPGTFAQQQQAAYQQNPYMQQAMMTGVPQGGGGGMAGAPSGQGATLGNRATGGYAPPSGNRADIMQGERGGGFSGYGSGPQPNTDEFSNYGRYNTRNARGPAAAGRGDGGYLGMDLKRYLPGGMFDPGRQVGGMYRRANSEIMGQTADLFRHITDRMQERCRLGLLYDCR